MAKSHTNPHIIHTHVDEFVRYLNTTGFEPKFPDQVPWELRVSNAEYGMVNWRIQPSSSNTWIETLAQQLPQRWPRPYCSLIERYRFCHFEVGPVMFFANTGQDVFYELSKRMFCDKGLHPTLHQHGFLQFGNPHEANYDPVCFDMKRRHSEDAPIVQLDHEEVLIRNRIRVVQEIAPSFMSFMQRAIAEKFAVL